MRVGEASRDRYDADAIYVYLGIFLIRRDIHIVNREQARFDHRNLMPFGNQPPGKFVRARTGKTMPGDEVLVQVENMHYGVLIKRGSHQ